MLFLILTQEEPLRLRPLCAAQSLRFWYSHHYGLHILERFRQRLWRRRLLSWYFSFYRLPAKNNFSLLLKSLPTPPRREGTPDAGAGTAFTDVAGGAYYAQSVAWASANGIVNGFEDGSFRPGEAITREQMAAIFMRYARYRGVDVTAQASLDSFPDQAKVSSYAREAMAWSVSTGLIGGMDGLLVPGGSATRAQAATILMRLCVNVLEAP